MLDNLFWTLVGFLLGAIPFSLLRGKLFAKKDIRTVGDGNPGGAIWKDRLLDRVAMRWL